MTVSDECLGSHNDEVRPIWPSSPIGPWTRSCPWILSARFRVRYGWARRKAHGRDYAHGFHVGPMTPMNLRGLLCPLMGHRHCWCSGGVPREGHR